MRFVFILSFSLYLTLDSFSSAVKYPASLFNSTDKFCEKVLEVREIPKFIYQLERELIPVICFKTRREIKGDAIIVGVNGNALIRSLKYTFQPFHDSTEGPDWCNTGDHIEIYARLYSLKFNLI